MKKYLAVFLLLLILLPNIGAAANAVNACKGTPAEKSVDILPRCVNQIYTWSLGAVTLLAMLMMVVGGYQVMTAGGNAEQSTKGKDMIHAAIVGIVLLFVAYILLRTINPSLVNFNLDSLKTR